MKVQVINKSKHPLPQYATEQSAGMDLRANLDTPITLRPLERCLVPTGLFIALPQGYEAQVRPRSGLALKKGITVLNTPGTIDADYTGSVKAIMFNHSDRAFKVEKGSKVTQLVILPIITPEIELVDFLEETDRGANGFGSSGK